VLFWPVEVIMVGFFTGATLSQIIAHGSLRWFPPSAQQAGYDLPRIPQFKRNSTRKVVYICQPMVGWIGTALPTSSKLLGFPFYYFFNKGNKTNVN